MVSMTNMKATAERFHNASTKTASMLSKKAKRYASDVPAPVRLPARAIAATGGSAAHALAFLLGTGARLTAGTTNVIARIPGQIGHSVTYVISGKPTHKKPKRKPNSKPKSKPKSKAGKPGRN
jgi:hypothetical protein